MDFAQAYNLMDPSDESGFKPQDMESYDCRIVAGDFGGDYGLIGKNNKGWLECSGDEWAFGFRRKAPKAVYKTIQVEEGSECNCAIPRRCDKNQGRCRWGPKMVDKDVFDYYVRTVERLMPDAEWCAAGIGANQLTLNEWSIAAGGHARTGLEDNIRLDRDRLAPSNAALVRRTAEICAANNNAPVSN